MNNKLNVTDLNNWTFTVKRFLKVDQGFIVRGALEWKSNNNADDYFIPYKLQMNDQLDAVDEVFYLYEEVDRELLINHIRSRLFRNRLKLIIGQLNDLD